MIAYQLAVVVDDFQQDITEIVRGIDLMDSTPRQIWLQQLLGYPTANYLHIPVATFPNGQKLSKNTGATGVPLNDVATPGLDVSNRSDMPACCQLTVEQLVRGQRG